MASAVPPPRKSGQRQFRLQGSLHQMLGELGQDPALAHQPQPALGGLLGRQRGQLLQQLGGQTVR
ncbi:hypothetical protein AB0L67_41050, partial [Streptomyces flaveolus]|uniref:hypothetical protein n=1 Tax=Streptomyces flaveolus TaxID=67297 RepID=UPI003426C869